MKIKVEKPSNELLEARKIKGWPIWEKEVSEFDWFYDSEEECYILEGRVTIKTAEGDVEFGKGDFVTFPEGLSCKWIIKEPVRKHYSFK